MPNLMDTISRRMSAMPQDEGPEIDQAQIEKVARAKAGRAGAGAGPGMSGLQQETAISQAREGQQQQRLAGTMAGAQLQEQARAQQAQAGLAERGLEAKGQLGMEQLQAKEQQAAANRQANEADARSKRTAQENMRLDSLEATSVNAIRSLLTNRQVSLDNLFGDKKRSDMVLSDRKDAAEIEQDGFNLAFSDRVYMDNLHRTGRERRLDNQQIFDTEMQNMIFGDTLAAVMKELNFAVDMNVSQREWEKQLADMGQQQVRQLSRAVIRDGQHAGAMGAGGEMMKQAYEDVGQATTGIDTSGGGSAGGSSGGPDTSGTAPRQQGVYY